MWVHACATVERNIFFRDPCVVLSDIRTNEVIPSIAASESGVRLRYMQYESCSLLVTHYLQKKSLVSFRPKSKGGVD